MGNETVSNGGHEIKPAVAQHVTAALAAACIAAGQAEVGPNGSVVYANVRGPESPGGVQNPVDRTHGDYAEAPKWS